MVVLVWRVYYTKCTWGVQLLLEIGDALMWAVLYARRKAQKAILNIYMLLTVLAPT